MTASAWVWSTYLNGTMAWRIASTDGDGAAGSIVPIRSSRAMSVSERAVSLLSASSCRMRTGANPAGSMVARSQPLPLTQRMSSVSPKMLVSVSFTDVLPPPCSTSLESCPSSRDVYARSSSSVAHAAASSSRQRLVTPETAVVVISRRSAGARGPRHPREPTPPARPARRRGR